MLPEQDSPSDAKRRFDLLDLATTLAGSWKLLLIGPLVIGSMALLITFAVPKTFTARAVILPPQQQQSAAVSALASLGALSGLAGAVGGLKSPVEQYVALMQSTTVADRIIDEFDLMSIYDEEYRVEARKELARNVRIAAGRKDGLITVEVDDEDPVRSARMANRYVEELRRLTTLLALTEAQQRRVFFEQQLTQTRDKLAAAQLALQEGGFTPGALKAEPRAAAESYAKLRAEVTAAELRLQAMRRSLADSAPEVQQQAAMVSGLRVELSKLEASSDVAREPGYVGRYREFKYQETLFDLFARQFELARLDESREGILIQVIDTATPAERKSKPKRAVIAVVATIASGFLLLAAVALRELLGRARRDPDTARRLSALRAAAAGKPN
jgi:uncharacterized protein involved in exopolysaccharide biosynthesis